MSLKYKKCVVRIIGVALEGRSGSPVIVFDDPENGGFLTVTVDPFDAEILIRDFIGESDHSAAGWLGDLLQSSPPRRGIVEIDNEAKPVIKLEFGNLRTRVSKKNRTLPFGDGLTLIHRLSIPLYADERLFGISREELSYLTESSVFGGDFLYLTKGNPASYGSGKGFGSAVNVLS